jgi:hypothetical protein
MGLYLPDLRARWSDGARLKYSLRTGLARVEVPATATATATATADGGKALRWEGNLSTILSGGGTPCAVGEAQAVPAAVWGYVSVAQRALARCLKEVDALDRAARAHAAGSHRPRRREAGGGGAGASLRTLGQTGPVVLVEAV